MTKETDNIETDNQASNAPRRGRPPAGLHIPTRSGGVMNYATEEAVTDKRIIGGIEFPKERPTSFDYSNNKKLDIPKELLNNELAYRWVPESAASIRQYESLGYARVSEEAIQGLSVRRDTSSSIDSKVVLMATPKEWATARQIEKDRNRRKIEEKSQSVALKKDGSVDDQLYIDKATSYRSELEKV